MSTATNSPVVPNAFLSSRDFRVCDICGKPAMTHPRYEISARLFTTEKRINFCCACMHEQVAPLSDLTRHGLIEGVKSGDQIWRCCECGSPRPWGLLEPSQRNMRPALGCTCCAAVTRHRFLRVA